MAFTPDYVNSTDYLTPTLWNNTQDGIKAVEDGSLHLLYSGSWDYSSKTFTVKTSSSFIIYGCRGSRGFFAMLPINAEVCEVYDTFDFTISHTTSDNLNHTITFSQASNPYGSNCPIYVVGF